MSGEFFSRQNRAARGRSGDLFSRINKDTVDVDVFVEGWSRLLDNIQPLKEENQVNPEIAEPQKDLPPDQGSAPGGYLSTDAEGVIQEVDHNLAVLLQTSRHRLTGKSLSAFIAKESQAEYQTRLERVVNSDRVQEWKAFLHLKNAKDIPVTLTATAACSQPGQVMILRWFIRDLSNYASLDARQLQELSGKLQASERRADQLQKQMDILKEKRAAIEKALSEPDAGQGAHKKASTTELAATNELLQAELLERKRAEMEAARRARHLSALHAATSALLHTLELEPLLGQILDAATSAVQASQKGMLHLIARDTGQLEMRAVIGYTDPRIQKFNFQGSRGYVAKAVRERIPLLIKDVPKDPSIRYDGTIPEVRAIQSAIVAPLILNDTVLGALSLDSASKNAFTEEDLELLVSFAATATAAIRNAMLHAEVQKLALTDTLTNLYNRRGFFELGRREVERTRRFNRPLSAIMVDMDHFKVINDTFGHANGDQVLRLVAARLRNNVREIDVIGRYGGDEFTLLLPETDLFIASSVAERLRQIVSETPVMVGEDSIRIAISLGVAKLAPDTKDLAELVDSADAALYHAKQAGRNRVEIG